MQYLEIWNNVAPAEVEAYRLISVNILISLDNSNESYVILEVSQIMEVSIA